LSKRIEILLSFKTLPSFLFSSKPFRISTALSLAVWIKAVLRLNSLFYVFIAFFMQKLLRCGIVAQIPFNELEILSESFIQSQDF